MGFPKFLDAVPQNAIIAVIIVIVLILIYYCAAFHTSAQEDYLYGFWVAEGDAFCSESGIDSILLFIGEPTGWFSQTRNCYLVINPNVENQGFTLNYRTSFTGVGLGEYSISAAADFDAGDAIWPADLCLTTDMRTGTLKIYSDDTIYAVLVKQHETTNTARADIELVE